MLGNKLLVGIALTLSLGCILLPSLGCDEGAPGTGVATSQSGDYAQEDDSPDKETVASAGRDLARRVIDKHLKSPASADYQSSELSVAKMSTITDAEGESARRWRVTGVVDSQNGFGAMMRSRWAIEVMMSDGKYFPGLVELEDRIAFELPGYRSMVVDSEQREVEEHRRAVETARQQLEERQSQKQELRELVAKLSQATRKDYDRSVRSAAVRGLSEKLASIAEQDAGWTPDHRSLIDESIKKIKEWAEEYERMAEDPASLRERLEPIAEELATLSP